MLIDSSRAFPCLANGSWIVRFFDAISTRLDTRHAFADPLPMMLSEAAPVLDGGQERVGQQAIGSEVMLPAKTGNRILQTSESVLAARVEKKRRYLSSSRIKAVATFRQG